MFLLPLPNSAVINCLSSILSQSLCCVRSAAARIYKVQTWCRSCSRCRRVYPVQWQLMTHKSGQVKLPLPHTECGATTSKDYQRNDRNTQETHLQTFSDFLRKLRSKRERDSQLQCPQQPRKEGSWTLTGHRESCQWLKWGEFPETFHTCKLLLICTEIVKAQTC